MNGRRELAQRLADWLAIREWSPRRLSLAANVPENAVGRILSRPERETTGDTWRRLARYLGWDEHEVLALAGLEPLIPPPVDPRAELDRLYRQLGLHGRYLDHIQFQLGVLIEASQRDRPPLPATDESLVDAHSR